MNLKLKNKVMVSFLACTLLIFYPGVVRDYSGFKLIILKFAILILGVLCGIGLQKAFLEMTSMKERITFSLLLTFIVIILGISINLGSF